MKQSQAVAVHSQEEVVQSQATVVHSQEEVVQFQVGTVPKQLQSSPNWSSICLIYTSEEAKWSEAASGLIARAAKAGREQNCRDASHLD